MDKNSIVWFRTVTSTNDVALSFVKQGCQEGLVVVSDFQTKGRGRQGRKWESCFGKDLLFSLVLRPKSDFLQDQISLIAAVSVASVLKKKFNIICSLRWPNDIIFENKKLCGILVEGSPKDRYFVVGIGININSKMSELPQYATSLSLIKKTTFDRKQILTYLIDYCEAIYGKAGRERNIILKEATLICETLGRPVSIMDRKKTYTGYAIGLDMDGSLILRLDTGIQKLVRSAEAIMVRQGI